MITEPTEVLNGDEASELVRLSTSYMAKLRMRGDGPPFIKVGGRVLYRRAALMAWLAAREVSSTSEYASAR